jgi:hypothetical protein
MSNRAALAIGLLVILAVAADLWLNTGAVLFLMQKFVDLTEYIAFWR